MFNDPVVLQSIVFVLVTIIGTLVVLAVSTSMDLKQAHKDFDIERNRYRAALRDIRAAAAEAERALVNHSESHTVLRERLVAQRHELDQRPPMQHRSRKQDEVFDRVLAEQAHGL